MNNNPLLFADSSQRPVEMENLKSMDEPPQQVQPVLAQQMIQQPMVNMPVVQQAPQTQTVGPSAEILAMEEQTSLLLFVLGFMSHWVWLVGWLRYRKSQSNGARKWSTWSRTLFILHVLFVVSVVCLALCVTVGVTGFSIIAGAGAAQDNDNWE